MHWALCASEKCQFANFFHQKLAKYVIFTGLQMLNKNNPHNLEFVVKVSHELSLLQIGKTAKRIEDKN